MPFFSLPPFPPTPGSELLITYLITISSPQLTRTSNRSKKTTAKAQECDDETKNDLGSQSKFYALHVFIHNCITRTRMVYNTLP